MSIGSDAEFAELRFRRRQDPRRLWHLFWSLTRPYLIYADGAKRNFIWVVILSLFRSAFSVVFSFISRDFWTALQHKDVTEFWHQILFYGVVLSSALPILVWYSYERDRLALRWRRWYTEKVLADYFAKRNYYEIDQDGSVDNPDQRISQDIESFTVTSLQFFLDVLVSIMDLVNFSMILFSIYRKLFLVLIAYSTIGTFCATYIGRRLINLNFLQLQKEADFRYALIRVRENAESIAFYKGEEREKYESRRRFTSLFSNKIDLLCWSRNLSFFTTSYTFLIQILPLSVIAPMYFAGQIEMGVVSQAQQAFAHVLDDLSIIVKGFEEISRFSAGIDRLGELEEFIYKRFAEDADLRSFVPPDTGAGENDKDIGAVTNTFERTADDDSDSGPEKECSAIVPHRADATERFRELRRRRILYDNQEDYDDVEFGAQQALITTKISPVDTPASITVSNLTLMTPDKRRRVLFEGLSFNLNAGERLLIVGPSGTGKSSALRALAGLWRQGRGTITRPRLSSIFFLPQKPYCTLGTLREQLVYPKPLSEATTTEEELKTALELVNLSEIVDRMGGFDSMYDWSNVLSLGEQQRLAFARLIVGKPALAILDECSSALDVPTESLLYSHLRNSDIGYISVGHRPTLIQYHDFMLRMGGPNGSYTFERVTEGSTAGH